MSAEYTAHATGENESRELRFRFSHGEGELYKVVIWWGRGDKALATLDFEKPEMQALRDWLNENVD